MNSETRPSINVVTWGQFILRLQSLGVELRDVEPDVAQGLPEGGKYFYRRVGDEHCWWPLPRKYDADSSVGPYRVDSIMRRMKLTNNELNMPVIL